MISRAGRAQLGGQLKGLSPIGLLGGSPCPYVASRGVFVSSVVTPCSHRHQSGAEGHTCGWGMHPAASLRGMRTCGAIPASLGAEECFAPGHDGSETHTAMVIVAWRGTLTPPSPTGFYGAQHHPSNHRDPQSPQQPHAAGCSHRHTVPSPLPRAADGTQGWTRGACVAI